MGYVATDAQKNKALALFPEKDRMTLFLCHTAIMTDGAVSGLTGEQREQLEQGDCVGIHTTLSPEACRFPYEPKGESHRVLILPNEYQWSKTLLEYYQKNLEKFAN